MPNTLDANGLQTYTRDEVVTILQNGYKSIYGNDINLDQDTPDAQQINIFSQIVSDNLDLLTQIFNSFDPDKSFGRVLDQRVALNGIQRQGGTYSRTMITIVNTQSITLRGFEDEADDIYTVTDGQGNNWLLVNSISIPTAGSNSLEFQSEVAGRVLTTPNTITVPVTIILGVDSINNPLTQSVIGEDEESDADLKLRRQQSVALASQGYKEGLLAALKNISGITDAFVYENNSGATDVDGVPSHSIWVIVAGNYLDEDVANAIYKKRNAGCGMKGDLSYIITQIDTSQFLIKWDEVETIPLFIKFTATSINGVNPPNYDLIRSDLPLLYLPEVYGQVNTNLLSTYIQQLDSNCLVSNAGFSELLAGPYDAILYPSTKKRQFVILSANIIILPILTNYLTLSVSVSTDTQFTAKGGYGSYTWSMQVNNSGGSVVPATGLYSAGATPGVDTVRVTDDDGNFTDITVTVI